eukprot:scaffold15503_cov60-Phaeocystis_antarctica.AAC.5
MDSLPALPEAEERSVTSMSVWFSLEPDSSGSSRGGRGERWRDMLETGETCWKLQHLGCTDVAGCHVCPHRGG